MTQVINLDVSLLEPPHPMKEITKLLATLPENGLLRITHRRNPIPLFDVIKADFSHRHIEINDDEHIILIWRNDDSQTSEYARTRNNENDWA